MLEHIRAAQTEKKAKRGGYDSRFFVEWVERPEGSADAEYCASQPNKYPESE